MAEAHSTPEIIRFKSWLKDSGGGFHPNIGFMADQSGLSIVAVEGIPADTSVVDMPFSLAITPSVSRTALENLRHLASDPSKGEPLAEKLEGLSERQLICIYICLHWVEDLRSQSTILRHRSYLDTLPDPSQLTTPLHFTEAELAVFKGSNLYGATVDRERLWKAEWQACQEIVGLLDPKWAEGLTWTRYLTASTYLSSRAFPSTLLSPNPTLRSSPTSYPVLLPGIDALNHARGAPVSWVITSKGSSFGTATGATQEPLRPTSVSEDASELGISLVIHTATPVGGELFNNYGPKPNAELILGYGFSLAQNPDDTIVLKIGGSSFRATTEVEGGPGKFEVGRNARGADAVWTQILDIVRSDGEERDREAEGDPDERSYEDELEAAELLFDMVKSLMDRLPSQVPSGDELRPTVVQMLHHYLEGQHDILDALLQFAQQKERAAIELAQEHGIELVFEDDDDVGGS